MEKEKLNEIVFWNEVIESLELKIGNWVQSNSKVFTQEYFNTYENNPFHTYGRMCLALNEAKVRRQKINDEFIDKLSSSMSSPTNEGNSFINKTSINQE